MKAPPFVLLGNGAVAVSFLRDLVARKNVPVLLVLNAAGRQRDGETLRALANSAGIAVLEWDDQGPQMLGELAAKHPDLWLVSVYFAHLLRAPLLAAVGGRAVNLHAALLPWNRGVNTNVWPIVEGTPAGVSLHAMLPDVDAGPILAQEEVAVSPADTAATLYARLEAAAIRLLAAAWPGEVLARWPGVKQAGEGSMHRLKDFEQLAEYDLDAHPEAKQFFDLLRARSFPPYPGLIVRVGGSKVEAVVTLKEVQGG